MTDYQKYFDEWGSNGPPGRKLPAMPNVAHNIKLAKLIEFPNGEIDHGLIVPKECWANAIKYASVLWELFLNKDTINMSIEVSNIIYDLQYVEGYVTDKITCEHAWLETNINSMSRVIDPTYYHLFWNKPGISHGALAHNMGKATYYALHKTPMAGIRKMLENWEPGGNVELPLYLPDYRRTASDWVAYICATADWLGWEQAYRFIDMIGNEKLKEIVVWKLADKKERYAKN